MSFNGIQQFAAVLGIMQDTRHELLGGDNQDIRLGQLLEEAKECVKDRFAEETLDEQFIEHMEKASKTVLGWPTWKRSVLGPDQETVDLSMKAIDEGDTEPIQEIIDSCFQWTRKRRVGVKAPAPDQETGDTETSERQRVLGKSKDGRCIRAIANTSGRELHPKASRAMHAIADHLDRREAFMENQEASLKEFDEGDTEPIQEIIDELEEG